MLTFVGCYVFLTSSRRIIQRADDRQLLTLHLQRHIRGQSKTAHAGSLIQSLETASLKTGTSNDDEAVNEVLPTFVFHVGLPKTGTTFLQCNLSGMYVHNRSVWEKDNYVYLGTYGCIDPLNIPSFSRMHDPFVVFHGGAQVKSFVYDPTIDMNDTELEMNPDFIASINQLAAMRTNVLFIFEPMSQFRPYQIQQLRALIEPHWNIQVTVAYRRLFEWLPSMYNQLEKTKKSMATWPEHDSIAGVTFPFTIDVDSMDNATADETDMQSLMTPKYYEQFKRHGKHPAELVMDLYKRHLTANVAILPTHSLGITPTVGVDPLLEYFFCGDLLTVTTPHLCQELRQGGFDGAFPADIGAINQAVPLNFDILAVAAYQQNMVPAQLSRPEVVERLRLHQEDVLTRSATDFPLQCMSASKLDELEELSMFTEERLLPSTNTTADSHRQGFLARKNSSFCHVDTSRALADPSWVEFFGSLS
jgi:hypothetical protein